MITYQRFQLFQFHLMTQLLVSIAVLGGLVWLGEVQSPPQAGALIPILQNTPPPNAPFACLYPHRRLLDPKVRLFIDFMTKHCRERLTALTKKDGP